MKKNSMKNIVRTASFFLILAAFSLSQTVFGGQYFLSLPKARVNAQEVSEKIESIPSGLKALEALKVEGSSICALIEKILPKTMSMSPVWAGRGVTVELSEDQASSLQKSFPELSVEPLSQTAVPIQSEVVNDKNKAPTPPWNLTVSGAMDLRTQKNLTGKGVLIGIIGVDVPYSHPSLKSRIKFIKKFGPPPPTPPMPNPAPENVEKVSDDLILLHPLGVLSGNNPLTEMGVAPDVHLAVALVPRGQINAGHILDSLQWLMAPSENQVPSAVLICVDFPVPAPKAIRQIIHSYRTAGILPIIPAGNNPDRITGMAALTECITVGAIDQWKNRALFSGQGPCMEGQVSIAKPDFMEPGVGILGPSNDNNGYKFGSGTLQAAAHFAGIWALLRETVSQTNEEILTAMATTTIDLGPVGQDYQTGLGLPDPLAALNYILNPPPPPVPFPAR